MRYSEIVNAIKGNTLAELESLLSAACEGVLSGSTRRAYMFDHFVVKIEISRWKHETHNANEYAQYCDYISGASKVPIVYTRMYRTRDGAAVLVQERMYRVFEIVLSYNRERHYTGFYTEINDSYGHCKQIKDSLIAAGVPHKAFYDGLQCGYNKRNQIRFYDYSRMWKD